MEVGEHEGGGVCVSCLQHHGGTISCSRFGHIQPGVGGEAGPTSLWQREIPFKQ